MKECNDIKCAKHGEISVRGNIFTGKVVSAKPSKTILVDRELISYVPKYERYKKVKSRVYAHNPECLSAREGDIVKVGETRKLSKTKAFTLLEIVKRLERKEVRMGEISEFVKKKVKEEGKGTEKRQESDKI